MRIKNDKKYIGIGPLIYKRCTNVTYEVPGQYSPKYSLMYPVIKDTTWFTKSFSSVKRMYSSDLSFLLFYQRSTNSSVNMMCVFGV